MSRARVCVCIVRVSVHVHADFFLAAASCVACVVLGSSCNNDVRSARVLIVVPTCTTCWMLAAMMHVAASARIQCATCGSSSMQLTHHDFEQLDHRMTSYKSNTCATSYSPQLRCAIRLPRYTPCGATFLVSLVSLRASSRLVPVPHMLLTLPHRVHTTMHRPHTPRQQH